jgi:hypothetical protein
MKLTLIRMPALLPVLLLSSQIVLAADPVPKFDTGPSCLPVRRCSRRHGHARHGSLRA